MAILDNMPNYIGIVRRYLLAKMAACDTVRHSYIYISGGAVSRRANMANDTVPDQKVSSLRKTATLNTRADKVRHPLFAGEGFFDARDLLQVKYETVRAVRVEGCSIAQASRDFGLSRPTVYEIRTGFEKAGLAGLLPHRRGPRQAHKLTEEVVEYIEQEQKADSGLKTTDLVARVKKRFGVQVHSRSLERALERRQKKGRHNRPQT